MATKDKSNAQRNKEFFSQIFERGVSLYFEDEMIGDRDTEFCPPIRNIFTHTLDGWVWIHNDGPNFQLQTPPHSTFAELLKQFTSRLQLGPTNTHSQANAVIGIRNLSADETVLLFKTLESMQGLSGFELMVDDAKETQSNLKEGYYQCSKNEYGSRTICIEDFRDSIGSTLESVLYNFYTSLSGGPMLHDGEEMLLKETGTNHYWHIFTGDLTVWHEQFNYLGNCRSKKEAISRMIKESELWEINKDGDLIDVAKHEE